MSAKVLAQTFSFFSIEVYDPVTSAVLHEIYLEDFEEDHLPQVFLDKIKSLARYEAKDIDLVSLMSYPEFCVGLKIFEGLPVRVRHESSMVPYRIHSGREFDLMMKGLKPLSVFSDVSPEYAEFLKKYFDPLVKSGQLKVAEIVEPDIETRVLYALPREAWRIEAYRLMRSTARSCKWNDVLERIEGSLLGYTSEQNDYHIKNRARQGLRWGAHAVYRFLSQAEADFVRKTGGKAFSIDLSDSAQIYLPRYFGEETHAVDVLSADNRRIFSQFFVSIVDIFQFPSEMVKIKNLEFEVFRISGSDLIYLNNKIDGTIDIFNS